MNSLAYSNGIKSYSKGKRRGKSKEGFKTENIAETFRDIPFSSSVSNPAKQDHLKRSTARYTNMSFSSDSKNSMSSQELTDQDVAELQHPSRVTLNELAAVHDIESVIG